MIPFAWVLGKVKADRVVDENYHISGIPLPFCKKQPFQATGVVQACWGGGKGTLGNLSLHIVFFVVSSHVTAGVVEIDTQVREVVSRHSKI